MECLRTECTNRSANAIANIKIQFFNIKIQFIDIIKHGTENKIYNLECKIQILILAVITLHTEKAYRCTYYGLYYTFIEDDEESVDSDTTWRSSAEIATFTGFPLGSSDG
jgi:hypothetical protein